MSKKRVTKLDTIIAEIQEDFGKDIFESYETISSYGVKEVDRITGGLPNRIIELYGAEGCGKTTLTLHAIADKQKEGKKRCVFIDAEGGMTPEYAQKMGVDTDKWIYVRKNNMEDVLKIVLKFLQSDEVGLIVLDSLAGLVPSVVEEDFLVKEDLKKKHVADRARLMSECLPLLMSLCIENRNTLIIINQMRQKIGLMIRNPNTTPGGKALKHFAMQRLYLVYTGKVFKQVKGVKMITGRKIKIVAEKNKVKDPDEAVELVLVYGKGFKI